MIILDSQTLWNNRDNHDKVYSVFLFECISRRTKETIYAVTTQWGRRGVPPTPSREIISVTSPSKENALRAYHRILDAKANRGYNETIKNYETGERLEKYTERVRLNLEAQFHEPFEQVMPTTPPTASTKDEDLKELKEFFNAAPQQKEENESLGALKKMYGVG